MIEVTIPQGPQIAAAFEQAPMLVLSALNRAVAKGTIYLQGQIRQDEPVDTGRMRNATTSELLPEVITGKVVVNVNYGIYVNDGTGIFAVHPELTTGRLTHGGIKPRQFVEQGVRESQPEIQLYFDKAGDEILAGLLA